MDKVFSTIGASSHSSKERAKDDFYATDPIAIDYLLKHIPVSFRVWECACGQNHLADRLRENGRYVYTSDIVKRCNDNNIEIIDFLNYNGPIFDGDIVTNPPYKYAQQFVEKAMSLVMNGSYIIMLLNINFLSGVKRKKLFSKFSPKYVYIFTRRLHCARNGIFDKKEGSAITYAWFVWQKGSNTEPIIRWIDN